jgi:hypothetical protein
MFSWGKWKMNSKVAVWVAVRRLLASLFVAGLSTGISLADSFYAITALGNFGTIDPSTGVFNTISTGTVPDSTGIDETPGGGLYEYDFSNHLSKIDATTGATTLVGIGSIPGFGFGSFYTSGGLTDGEYFAINFNGDLYSINLTTGATTKIGNTGINLENSTDILVCESTGLAGSSTTLYYAATVPQGSGCTSNQLYSIDPTTALATLIGPTNGANQIAGAAYDNGKLYAFTFTQPPQIFALDTTTATASFQANTSELIIGGVPIAPVPELSSVLLLGSVLAGLAAFYRRDA